MIRDIVRSLCELVILRVYNVNIKYKLFLKIINVKYH